MYDMMTAESHVQIIAKPLEFRLPPWHLTREASTISQVSEDKSQDSTPGTRLPVKEVLLFWFPLTSSGTCPLKGCCSHKCARR